MIAVMIATSLYIIIPVLGYELYGTLQDIKDCCDDIIHPYEWGHDDLALETAQQHANNSSAYGWSVRNNN